MLSMSATARNSCFEVNITDDNRFEGRQPESFEVRLAPLSRAVTDLQGIRVEPSVAMISILDNDNMIFIGFEQDVENVSEVAGMLQACVGLLMDDGGKIEEEFGVRVVLLSDRSSAGGFV